MEAFNKFIEEQNKDSKFKKVIGDYTYRFGKYRDKTYDEVYNSDKNYVHFVVNKLDYDKNKKLIDYYKERINKDFA